MHQLLGECEQYHAITFLNTTKYRVYQNCTSSAPSVVVYLVTLLLNIFWVLGSIPSATQFLFNILCSVKSILYNTQGRSRLFFFIFQKIANLVAHPS